MNKSEFVQQLFREQASPLLNYLTARFRNREDAQEVAQEAWLRIYRLEHPEALNNPRAFLFRTASNLAVDRLRRSVLERHHHDRESRQPPLEGGSLEERMITAETLAVIEQALGELPEKCRQAFVMHRSHGMPYPDIAAQLGISTSMVEKYIIQALKHFRKRLRR